MPSTKLLITVLMTVPMAFAQRGGGHAGSVAVVHPAPVRPGARTDGPGVKRGPYYGRSVVGFGHVRRRFGYGPGYFASFSPIWDYGSVMPPYGNAVPDEYPEDELRDVGPSVDGGMPAPYPPKPASSVIREYSFGDEAPVRTGNQPTFTIVLTDGSTRSAVASWVQNGKLHYMDLQSRSQVLGANIIDRSATERANAANNLRMDLPPG